MPKAEDKETVERRRQAMLETSLLWREKHHPTTLTDPDIDYWKRDSAETRRIRQEEDAKDAEAYRNDPLLWDEESEYRC